MAGLTGAVIVLPQGVAFAMIAGMPPVYGLYTAIVVPIIAALFGSSKHLVSGPTTAISLVVLAALSGVAEPGSDLFVQLAITLAFMAGAIQFLFGLGRMGTLVNFVSHTVVVGFTAGAAILIATNQLKHILGVKLPTSHSFLETWVMAVKAMPQSNVYALGLAFFALAVSLLLKWKAPRLPGMLIALLASGGLAVLLGGSEKGIAFVGEMPAHLPPFSMPTLSLETLRELLPNAFAIALLGLIEAVAIARSIAVKSGQRIDGNQEFVGQGLSNLIGSFFSAYPGSGSFTRSGINYQAGARTPMAAIFAAVFLSLILLFVAPYTAYLPMAAMGGIIALVGYNLIDFKQIREILHTSKQDSLVLGITFFTTLFAELEFAIYAGMLMSLFFYLKRTSQPHIAVMAPDQEAGRKFIYTLRKPSLKECPQLKIIRIDGSLYFGAIDHISGQVKNMRSGTQRHLLIMANGINFVDLDGSEWLLHEAKYWQEQGGGLYIVGLKRIAQDVLESGGYLDAIGRDHFFTNKKEAISSIYAKLDRQICHGCTARIFEECREYDPIVEEG